MYSKAVIHGGRPNVGSRMAGPYNPWGETGGAQGRSAYPAYHPLYRTGIDGVADAPARRQCSQRSCKRMSPAAPPTAQLSERDSALLQKKYEEKVNHTKYELVAGFVVERGIIQAYTIYRLRVPFEVTERRRRIIQRYYSQGCQEVMLYVNKMEFEHYMPVSYRPLPNTSKTRQKKSKFKFFNLRR